MAVTVRELVTRWGFEIDDSKLKKLNKTLGATVKIVAIVGAAALAAGAAMFGLAKSIADTGDEIAKTARALGITTDLLQELRFAAGIAGVSTKELDTGLRKFTRTILEAQRGTETYLRPFRELGFTTEEITDKNLTTEKAFKLVADKLAAMPAGFKRTALAQELFGRAGAKLIPLMLDGAAGIEKLQKEAGKLGLVMSKELLKANEDFQDELLRLQSVILGIKNVLGEELIPAFSELFTKIKDFILLNRELIVSGLLDFLKTGTFFLKLMAAGMTNVIRVFTTFGPTITSIIAGIVLLTGVIGSLAIAFKLLGITAAVAWSTVLLPILPIIGAVLAAAAAFTFLILVIEDIAAFFQGKSSIFGSLNEQFKELGTGLQVFIGAALIGINGLVSSVLTLVDAFNFLFGDLSFGDFIQKAGGRILNLVTFGQTGGGTITSALGLQQFDPESAVSPGDISNVGGDVNVREISIAVQGGETNAETGSAVSDGVLNGLTRFLREADLETTPRVTG